MEIMQQSPIRRKDAPQIGGMLPSLALDMDSDFRKASRISMDIAPAPNQSQSPSSLYQKSTAKGGSMSLAGGGAQRVSNLLHKLASSSGNIPGEHPSSSSLSSSGSLSSLSSKKDKVNKLQLQNLDQSAAIKRGFAQLIELYDEVNLIVQDLFYRKDLSTRVQIANDAYLSLFQNILAEILALHREKFKVELSDMDTLKQEVIRLHSETQAKNETINEMRSRISILDSANEHLTKQVEELKEQRESLLQEQKKDLLFRNEKPWQYVTQHFPDIVTDMREKLKKEQETIFHEKLLKIKKDIAKEQSQFNLNRARLQRQQMEQERLKRQEIVSSEVAARMSVKSSSVVEIERPETCEIATQTEVDDHGLWDKQDGWVLPISHSEEARRRWRQAIQFAACPHCKGVSGFIAKCAVLLRKVTRGPLTPQEIALQHKKVKWRYSDNIVRFLSNLPKSITAEKPYPLLWSVRRVWNLLEYKFQANLYDDRIGKPHQHLVEFVLEILLLREHTRKQAELQFYRLLTSLSEHYHKHPMLQLFSRFLGVLNSPDPPQPTPAPSPEAKPVRSIYLQGEKASELMDQREREQRERDRAKGIKKVQPKPAEYVPVSDHALPDALFLPAYFLLRKCFLHPYSGVYWPQMKQILKTTQCLHTKATRLGNEPGWPVTVPDHVFVCEDGRFFVPLDRVVHILHNCLSEVDIVKRAAIVRTLSCDCRVLAPSGNLHDPEVINVVVRSQCRQLDLALPADARDVSWDAIESEIQAKKASAKSLAEAAELEAVLQKQKESTDFRVHPVKPLNEKKEDEFVAIPPHIANKDFEQIVLLDMEHCLQLILDEFYHRLQDVETEAARKFHEKDLNHDGVLNLDEFSNLVSLWAPNYSRRKMMTLFRLAHEHSGDCVGVSMNGYLHLLRTNNLLSVCNVDELTSQKLAALAPTTIPLANDHELVKFFEGTPLAQLARFKEPSPAPKPQKEGHDGDTERKRKSSKQKPHVQVQTRQRRLSGDASASAVLLPPIEPIIPVPPPPVILPTLVPTPVVAPSNIASPAISLNAIPKPKLNVELSRALAEKMQEELRLKREQRHRGGM